MRLKAIVGGLALAGLAGHVAAQTAPAAPADQRVEITGSLIKRIQSEGALPLQVIRSDQIEAAGITSAEQLMTLISANGNGIDNMTTNQGGDFLNSLAGKPHNNGSAAASLRGLGAQYTLVLLNGRRLSTHGLNGQSVDLNSIPLAAVDRVEILKDGASAIYGTDAIGGVINFILKKDYHGLEATLFTDTTQHGGGNITRGSVLFGAGDLAADRYNFMASLTYDTNTRLRGSQRSFNNGYQPDRGLAPDTTGTPYAAIGVGSGTALSGSFTIPSYPVRVSKANLLALQGKCDSVPGQFAYRGDITGFTSNNLACDYDYGGQWSMMQPVDRFNLVSRGTFALSEQSSAFVEVVASHTKSAVEYTPIQLTSSAYKYPASGPYYQNLALLDPTDFKSTNTDPTDTRVFFDATKPEIIRWRCIPCGPRQQETTTDAIRALVGLEGTFSDWDYKVGLSAAQSKADTKLGDGMMYTDKLTAAMATGLINPFLEAGQSQTQQAMDLINGAKANGASLYGGKASVTELDGTFSREIFKLPAGAVSAALGFDIRQEKYRFADGTGNEPAINGVGSPPSLPEVSRDIRALFGELDVPLAKNLDLQLAARTDHYSDFGSTTNPKAALRWQPLEALLFRGSYSRGFHAPDYDALYGGTSVGQFNSDINDPVLCPTGNEPQGCGIRPEIDTTSNPNLKPERSKQWSVGFVVSPVKWASASLDFWHIDLTNRIAALSGQALIDNYAQYQQYVIRDPSTQEILSVNAPYQNLAGDQTQGADVNVSMNFNTDVGKWLVSLDGTYVDSYKTRFSDSDPWTQRVGQFGDTTYGFDLHLRWKHSLNASWSRGPWTVNASQNYSSGYYDEVDGYGSGLILQSLGFQSRVSSYTLYNASVNYKGFKNLDLGFGIKNLFDTKPPFSLHNVDNVAGAGWDARVGDPRMRSFTFRINYKFF